MHCKTINIQQQKINLHKTIRVQQPQISPATSHSKTLYCKIQHPMTTTTSKTIMPTPEFHCKTISTASTATRTLYTATVCSNHNINSTQSTTQCISISNQPFQPTPVLTDKWITAERHTNEVRRQKHRLL